MANFKIGDRVVHVTHEGPDMIVVSESIAISEHGSPGVQIYDCEFWSVVKGEFLTHRFIETSIKASERV